MSEDDREGLNSTSSQIVAKKRTVFNEHRESGAHDGQVPLRLVRPRVWENCPSDERAFLCVAMITSTCSGNLVPEDARHR